MTQQLLSQLMARHTEQKYVVVTVPMGVLKKNTIQFTPSLPEPVQVAIKNMGYGSMNKIFLGFDTAFWDPNATIILPYTSNPLVNYFMIYNLGKFVNKPILMTFSIGDFSKQFEKRSDREIINAVMAQIRLIYPSAPNPSQTAITRWGLDKFSNGAYSYPSLKTTFEDFVSLALPVQNKLFFAGEAVNQFKNGTADAAYTSGKNAASAILQINSQARQGKHFLTY